MRACSAARGVLLAGAFMWAGGAQAAEQRPQALLICVDGMDWTVLRPLIKKGRLPHIRRIVREGVHGEVATVRPVVSPPVWTSVATGKRPEKHGVVDYFSEGNLYSSDLRKTKALWNILSERGKRVGVVGYLVTYPAETVNGVVVSDFFLGEAEDEAQVTRQFANVEAGKLTYPAGLVDELKPRWAWEPYGNESARRLRRFMDFDFDPSHDPPRAPGSLYGDDRQLGLRLTLAWHYPRDETFVRIAERFLESAGFDLFVVCLTGVDAVGHEYLRFYDPAPGVSEEDKRRFGRVVPKYYEYVDEVVGRLRRLAPGAAVFVVSDHGMRRNPRNPEWLGAHRDVSVFMAAGPGIAPAGEVLGPADSVLDVAPTVLQLLGLPAGADMDGKVISRIFRGPARAELPRIETYDGLSAPSRGSGVVPGPAERERLRALGYLE